MHDKIISGKSFCLKRLLDARVNKYQFFIWPGITLNSKEKQSTMGDDSEWIKLPVDQKCEHKVRLFLELKFQCHWLVLSAIILYSIV